MSEKRPELVDVQDAGVPAVCHALFTLRRDAGGYVARNRINQMARFLVPVQYRRRVYRRHSGLPDWKANLKEKGVRN